MKLRRPFFKLLAALCLSFYCYNLASAETSTTDIYTSSPDDGSFSYDSNCPAGMSNAYVMDVGYANDGYSSGATAIAFGTCYDTFALTYTINQLLSEQGISVDKIHYGWKYINGCFNVTDPKTGQQIWCAENIEDRVDENGQPYGIYADQMDTLIVEVEITDANGNVIETRTYDYETWYHWAQSNPHSSAEVYLDGAYWQIEEDFIQLYDHTNNTGTIYTPDSLGDANFRVMSKDGGYWEGYYGPIVRDGQIWFTYRTNPCNDTAMYDPSCPGYAEAYATYEYDTNCSANATYDTGCPGYADAYYNQQCSADPLYDSGCSGYSEAYYNQQCSSDPLYDSGCNGYSSAYQTQQCNADSQYSYECPNYQFPKSTDPAMNVSGQGSDYIFIYRPNNPEQFDTLMADIENITNWVWGCEKSNSEECPGTKYGKIKDYMYDGGDYLFLYTTDENDNIVIPDSGRWYSFIEYDTWYTGCADDLNFDNSCGEYTRIQQEQQQAEYDSNCSANPLYDSGCPGYASAYETQQCNANPLYSSSCPGYSTAYYNYQCEADPLYDSGCSGYDVAYYNYQCEANPLYDSGCSGYDTAYYNQQCDANPLYDSGCTGYASAYLTAQCNADALYDASCTGHYEAQCDANPLYDFQCTGYDTAYLNQQCMYNPQYDTSCDGYVEPIVEAPQSNNQTIAEGAGTGNAIVDSVIATPVIIMPQPPAPMPQPMIIEVIPVQEPIEEATIEVIEIEVLEAEVEAEISAPVEEPVSEPEVIEEQVEETIEEPVVEEVDTTDETTEDTVEENNNEEASEEESSGDVEQPVDRDETDEKNTDDGGEDDREASEDTSGDTKEVKEPVATKKPVLTAKQKKRAKEKKMREIVKARLSKLAVTMGEAVSLADQQALQSQITALINYVPGFLQYGKLRVPGVDFYEPEDIYRDKKVPENQRGLRNGLANEILHNKMVDEQYKDMD